ncbi:putative aldouronate transport system permease protein [Paenibacillus sp. V4I3]|uniref:carbohydrate ABC transporter permease n=1 Tax=unclassified Paenibacillus TaxID=185978 RepID=UPI002786167A|nr:MULTISPECIES: carbohydrate ABC transporter permease [unclassified Paenibacillus]MDQ0876527.1 putative aldouronate transport system permease protein [Paenibacillus sp. V4I3]MDQ0887842.1 putative aldouronate transport system permease protein [Paenibacillus sp. V4I9]
MMKQTGVERSVQLLIVALLTMLCVTVLYPFLYMLAISLNEGADAAKGGVYLWPRSFTLINYEIVLGNEVIRQSYLITVARTVVGTVAGLFITLLVAFGLSYRSLPLRGVILSYILITMLFQGGLVPFYIQLNNLGLLNTFWVYILPGLFSVWNMFVMLKFIQGIPEALVESAELDGAGPVRILFQIIIPLSKPMLAALGLFTAVGHWNDWFAGAFFVTDQRLIPVQTFLQQLLAAQDLSSVLGSNNNQEALARSSQLKNITLMSIKMTVVMVSAIPILCVYPFLQKYFVKGVLVGSLKG